MPTCKKTLYLVRCLRLEDDGGIFLKLFKAVKHRFCALVTLRGRLFHSAHDDLLKARGDLGVFAAGIFGSLVHLHQRNGNGRLCIKGEAARGHLVHKNAERIKVASRVDGAAACLLGADIIDRTDSLIGHGNCVGIGKLRNAEIHHLDNAVAKEHDVLRLDVAVNYALLVRVVKRTEYLHGVAESFLKAKHLASVNIVFESDTLDIFHYDILYVIPYGNVVDVYDVGMRKHSNGFGFVYKSLHRRIVRGYVVAKYLDCYYTAHEQVHRLVYHSHTAHTDEGVYSVSVFEHLADIFFVVIHNDPLLQVFYA